MTSSPDTRPDARREARALFLRRAGWDDADLLPLAGDASFRRYFRLTRGEERRVLMDAPPPQEDVRPFVRIARHLLSLSLSAPVVHDVDEAAGFLLLEDLGDDTYARALANGADETMLYALATDVLVRLHGQGERALLPGLATYAGETLVEAAMLVPEWYVPAALERAATPEESESWREAWRTVAARLPAAPLTLVLRDFHQDNLLLLPERPGVRACGLLDFQDATLGHPAYDLVSLVEDARRDIDPALRATMIDRYVAEAGVADRAAFDAAYAILAAQRHARIIGLFIRLLRRDGKPTYLPHLPRVWRMFDRAVRHEALEPVRRWTERHLPPDKRLHR